MIQNLQPDLRQAFLVAGVERRRPRRVFAEDDGGLHLAVADKNVLGAVADRQRQCRRGQIAVERVLVLLVIGVNALADLVGGRAWCHERSLQPRSPGLQRQYHFADIACDDRIDLVLVDGALEVEAVAGDGALDAARDVYAVADEQHGAAADGLRGEAHERLARRVERAVRGEGG